MSGKVSQFEERFAKLKERAETMLEENPERTTEFNQAHDLIHELQVYQAELEIQNEELRASQQALTTSRDHFSYLYHEAPVGYVSLDRDGVVREANMRIASMLKLQVSDLVGKALQNFIYPGDREIYLGRYRAFYNSPQGKELELRMECADNTIIHALIEGRPTPISRVNSASDDVLVLMVINDISEKVAAEANLRLADKVIHTAQEAVIVTDHNGNIVSVNPSFERTTGYSKQEVLGRNPRLLQSGRQGQDFYQAMWQDIIHKGSWSGVVWNRRKDGEEYAERLAISCIRDSRKEITHFVGVFTDITQQLELEEQLRQAQKMEAIGTLVGGIAHDFNNMLAGITGNLYLARKASGDNAEVIAKLDTIDQLSGHAAKMISQMLVFARKDVVRKEMLTINEIVQHFYSSVARLSVPENISLNIEIDNDALIIEADTTQIQQTLLNLLTNARDAVEKVEYPKIDIVLSKYVPDDLFRLQHQIGPVTAMAHLMVRDNGCGMDEETKERVFDPFFTTKEVNEGTGLGLSMVYGAVTGSGGLIEVESETGEGTSVHLYFPLQQQDESPSSGNSTPVQDTELECHGELILIADDDAMLRDVLREMLEGIGYRVESAENGRALLDLFIQHREEVDLVLMDLVMPELGGWNAAEKLRRIRDDLPVIFMTGYDREQVFDAYREFDHSKVLTKPFPVGEINAAIRTLLSKTK